LQKPTEKHSNSGGKKGRAGVPLAVQKGHRRSGRLEKLDNKVYPMRRKKREKKDNEEGINLTKPKRKREKPARGGLETLGTKDESASRRGCRRSKRKE